MRNYPWDFMEGLTPAAKLLLLALHHLGARSGSTQRTVAELGSMTRCSISAIQRASRQLQLKGLLVVTPVNDLPAKYDGNLYRLVT